MLFVVVVVYRLSEIQVKMQSYFNEFYNNNKKNTTKN